MSYLSVWDVQCTLGMFSILTNWKEKLTKIKAVKAVSFTFTHTHEILKSLTPALLDHAVSSSVFHAGKDGWSNPWMHERGHEQNEIAWEHLFQMCLLIERVEQTATEE